MVIYSQHYEIAKLYQRRPIPVVPPSATAPFLRLRIRIPLGVYLSVCSECLVLSGRSLYNRPICHPDESYPVCVCVCVCVCVLIRRYNNILNLQWLGRRSQTKKDRNINIKLKYRQQISDSIIGNGFFNVVS